ncbi:DNA primase [Streptomyces sp. So13.3]|uniref:bifunctional DNA primase/polymerase n=1 Tax=Streptomyces sp. So13.3 TaxID=2136173 RepID=UPI0011072851|nr:bifunctional DNA primase/polymerase [Streptomyces sp. So13.3]QNA74179.1 DNA primase [Streptomyces sp. So13.3]
MPYLAPSRPGASELLTAALDAARRGWHVFPLVPGDKPPVIFEWEERATIDRDRIQRCWQHGRYNIGLATGPSRLVVVDLDTPKTPDDLPPPAWSLPGIVDGMDVLATLSERHGQPYPGDTFTVRTGRGGMHLYFAAAAGIELRNSGGKLGWKVDTRAVGGYVVAAGSTVNGRSYEIINDVRPAVLPDWLAYALTVRPSPPLRAHTGPITGSGAVGLVKTVLESGEGERNNRLYWAACRAYETGGEAAGGLAAALLDAAVSIGLPEREARATVASAARKVRGGR